MSSKLRGNTPEEDEALGCYTEGTITKVEGMCVTYDDGWCCMVRDCGVTPKVGDRLRVYGCFGRPFHGQALNGKLLWYITIAEQEAEPDYSKREG
jgi:hypothetical protein